MCAINSIWCLFLNFYRWEKIPWKMRLVVQLNWAWAKSLLLLKVRFFVISSEWVLFCTQIENNQFLHCLEASMHQVDAQHIKYFPLIIKLLIGNVQNNKSSLEKCTGKNNNEKNSENYNSSVTKSKSLASSAKNLKSMWLNEE